MQSVRRSVPFALAIFFLVFSAYRFMADLSAGEWRNSSDEMVTKWEDHVQALREALPSGVTQIGYMDASTVNGDSASFDVNEFQLMQYSLAPVTLDNRLDHEWIIGNFGKDTDFESWLTGNIGAHEVQGFGFGLYLIHDLEN